MNKSDLIVLEQAVSLEIRGMLLRRESGQIKRLALHGYLELRPKGYELTPKGRAAYWER